MPKPIPEFTPANEAPAYRRLRVFAFDPSLNVDLETAVVNQAVVRLPWNDDVFPGPRGRYLEVIDVDPASQCVYAPVNLNDPWILAQDGLPPSTSDPQFHQQMVYAVAMTTIHNFEQALGRKSLWIPRYIKDAAGKITSQAYNERLRIYPHALREPNAYYSREKNALLFGYFPANPPNPGVGMPGEMIFTCLSHSIIAHETAHALLDGTHPQFIEASNPDVLAFHEAFADIVALFQQFSFPEVLRHQIAKTRGNLRSENLLGQLAQQFGQGIGQHGALRDALGQPDKDGVWQARIPDPKAMQSASEPHDRGAILVAAVFDAFLSIYTSRVADLMRIASNGTGVLPQGAVHPDLVERLAQEAAKAAQHVLTMCIRALDYCPPMDITFGEYLRAIITADHDVVRDDRGYRVAMIEAFRRRGIYPWQVRAMAEDSLRWQPPAEVLQTIFIDKAFAAVLEAFEDQQRPWRIDSGRRGAYFTMQKSGKAFHNALENAKHRISMGRQMGLELNGQEKFWVSSVRFARRIGLDGQQRREMVIEITQQRWYARDTGERLDERPSADQAYFTFRGGCTLILDLEARRVRHCIFKNIDSPGRLERQRRFLNGEMKQALWATYFGVALGTEAEPFAMLHRLAEEEAGR
jgi:hypothetical protein